MSTQPLRDKKISIRLELNNVYRSTNSVTISIRGGGRGKVPKIKKERGGQCYLIPHSLLLQLFAKFVFISIQYCLKNVKLLMNVMTGVSSNYSWTILDQIQFPTTYANIKIRNKNDGTGNILIKFASETKLRIYTLGSW